MCAEDGKVLQLRNCSGVATPKLHPPPGMDGDGAAMAPPQVAPPVVRPLPPGQALYRRNESMHATQMERERKVSIAQKRKFMLIWRKLH